MGTNYIIEAQRLQKLAGIITESKLNELSSNPFKLTPEETRIADEILEIIQEGIFDIFVNDTVPQTVENQSGEVSRQLKKQYEIYKTF
jgi:hypothetical protein